MSALQDVKTVIPQYSAAQLEEEQLRSLSSMQELGSEEEDRTNSAPSEVSDHCFLLFDLPHSSHTSIAVFCAEQKTAKCSSHFNQSF